VVREPHGQQSGATTNIEPELAGPDQLPQPAFDQIHPLAKTAALVALIPRAGKLFVETCAGGQMAGRRSRFRFLLQVSPTPLFINSISRHFANMSIPIP